MRIGAEQRSSLESLFAPSHCGADESGLWLPSALEAAFMLHLIGSSFSKPVCVLSCLFSSLLKEVWPDRS